MYFNLLLFEDNQLKQLIKAAENNTTRKGSAPPLPIKEEESNIKKYKVGIISPPRNSRRSKSKSINIKIKKSVQFEGKKKKLNKKMLMLAMAFDMLIVIFLIIFSMMNLIFSMIVIMMMMMMIAILQNTLISMMMMMMMMMMMIMNYMNHLLRQKTGSVQNVEN